RPFNRTPLSPAFACPLRPYPDGRAACVARPGPGDKRVVLALPVAANRTLVARFVGRRPPGRLRRVVAAPGREGGWVAYRHSGDAQSGASIRLDLCRPPQHRGGTGRPNAVEGI